MTVQEFLTITSSTPPPALRQAMAAALAVEPTHRQEAFPRFYDRVLDELGLAGQPDTEVSKNPAQRASCLKPKSLVFVIPVSVLRRTFTTDWQ